MHVRPIAGGDDVAARAHVGAETHRGSTRDRHAEEMMDLQVAEVRRVHRARAGRVDEHARHVARRGKGVADPQRRGATVRPHAEELVLTRGHVVRNIDGARPVGSDAQTARDLEAVAAAEALRLAPCERNGVDLLVAEDDARAVGRDPHVADVPAGDEHRKSARVEREGPELGQGPVAAARDRLADRPLGVGGTPELTGESREIRPEKERARAAVESRDELLRLRAVDDARAVGSDPTHEHVGGSAQLDRQCTAVGAHGVQDSARRAPVREVREPRAVGRELERVHSEPRGERAAELERRAAVARHDEELVRPEHVAVADVGDQRAIR